MFGSILRSLAVMVCITAATTLHVRGAEGDTIIVRTLTFKDTTKRSGTWLFPPPGGRYEKVLIQYTLKCDPATTQDQYPCGEWDYLTYTVLRDSTGEFDSTGLKQVNFRVRNTTPDSFPYTNAFTAPKFRIRAVRVNRTGEGTWVGLGTQGAQNTSLIKPGGGRMRFVWTAAELTAAGITSGPIVGITLRAARAVAGVKLFTVRMAQQTGTTLPKVMQSDDMTMVMRRNIDLAQGANKLPFHSGFSWDGTSNIVIELSCHDAPQAAAIEANGGSNQGVVDGESRMAYAFTAGDRIEAPATFGPQLSDEVTVAFWCWGDAQKMPRAHNTVEAYDSRGRRVLNIHLPWDNKTVYWDCGIDPNSGAVDRIEKATADENFEGRWNHWAFVKTRSGEMRVYVNGTLFHTGSGKTLKMVGITRFVVGSGGSASYEGLLDEFQVWNVALDESTIRNYMHRKIADDHPQWNRLQLYYRADSDANDLVARDDSQFGYHGSLFGVPSRQELRLDQLGNTSLVSISRPFIDLETGSVAATSTPDYEDVTLAVKRTSVVLFERPVEPRIYRPDAADHPDVPTDTILVQEAGRMYTFDEQGRRVDSTVIPATATLRKLERPYFSAIVDFEIGRYITPYGIGLDLGPQGFRWEYDVTDFAPLLRNNVTLSAGNQQELIDLTFMFIKGTPPRDVKQIDQIYYDRGAMFPAVLAGTALPPVPVQLHPDARTFRLKAVTSGHDFSNETNCAEFCPRTHFLSVDGTERFSWLLWKECGDNPVFPQGGTWLIDRTGWCPGAPVDIYDFELTPFAQGKSSVTIDYGIKRQAANEAWGRWEVSTQLIGYGAPNHAKDVAIIDVISPNTWENYGRLNPICGQPVVIIENRGGQDLTSCIITSTVNGAGAVPYTWTGRLKFLERDTVVLPPATWPTTEGMHTFAVAAAIDGDEYAPNNSRTTSFVMPPVYYSDLQINLKTNKQAALQYEWRLRKASGEVIGEGKNLNDETTYTYDFTLENGCYDFELINKEGYGLDFWFLRSQLGTGSLSFRSGGVTVKTFEPDFGNRAWMQFTVAPKPTVITSTDSLFWSLPSPGREEKTLVIRAANSAGLRVDSVSAFSVRRHFSVVSTSVPLPVTLAEGDSVVVTVAFDRPDAGTTSGSLRVFCNDERNAAKQVRLVGTVLVTGVDDTFEPSMAVVMDVVPQPVTESATVRLQVYRADLLVDAEIVVRDLMGRVVSTIHRGALAEGEQRIAVPASIPSGSYVVSIESPLVRQSIPMVITR